jgi:hypothetical protein
MKLYLLLKSGPLSPRRERGPDPSTPIPQHPRWVGAVTSTVDLWRIAAVAEAIQILSVVWCSGNRSKPDPKSRSSSEPSHGNRVGGELLRNIDALARRTWELLS